MDQGNGRADRRRRFHDDRRWLRSGRRAWRRGAARRTDVLEQRAKRGLWRHAGLRQYRQIELARELIDHRLPLHETDRMKSGLTDGAQHGAQLFGPGLLSERTQVDADCRPFEQLRRRGYTRAQLVTDGGGVERVKPKLGESDLSDADLARGVLSGADLIHQDAMSRRSFASRAIVTG